MPATLVVQRYMNAAQGPQHKPVSVDTASALKPNSVLPMMATMTAIVSTTAPTCSSSGSAIHRARPVVPISGSKDLRHASSRIMQTVAAQQLDSEGLPCCASSTDQMTCIMLCCFNTCNTKYADNGRSATAVHNARSVVPIIGQMTCTRHVASIRATKLNHMVVCHQHLFMKLALWCP